MHNTEHFSFRNFFKTGFKNYTIRQKNNFEGYFTNPQFRERKMSLFNLSIFIHFTKIIIIFSKNSNQSQLNFFVDAQHIYTSTNRVSSYFTINQTSPFVNLFYFFDKLITIV